MRRLIALVAAAIVITGCRVDTAIDVAVKPDGSGVITVTATADKAVVDQAPGLARDLRFDDAEKAGWVNDRVSTPPSGGLQVVLHHDFTSAREATALLREVTGANGPLHGVEITRSSNADGVVTELHGTLRVDGGLDAFADPDLLKTIGATPYANDIEAAGLTPSKAITVAFTASLPGAKKASFSVPLDGSSVDLTTTGRLVAGGASNWGVAATVLLVAFVGWCLAAASFVVWVARQRRSRRDRNQPQPQRP
jgi:hypothetical protein